jgi:hypothetical protein
MTDVDQLATDLRRLADELDGAGYAPEAVVDGTYAPTMREAADALLEMRDDLIGGGE